MPLSPEEEERIRTLAEQGLTALAIGEAIGRHYNTVRKFCAKHHIHLFVAETPNFAGHLPIVRSVGVSHDAARKLPSPLIHGQCAFIIGDPLGEFDYCREAVKLGTSWCPGHFDRVFLDQAKMKRRIAEWRRKRQQADET